MTSVWVGILTIPRVLTKPDICRVQTDEDLGLDAAYPPGWIPAPQQVALINHLAVLHEKQDEYVRQQDT